LRSYSKKEVLEALFALTKNKKEKAMEICILKKILMSNELE
jgi:hypothetical protein